LLLYAAPPQKSQPTSYYLVKEKDGKQIFCLSIGFGDLGIGHEEDFLPNGSFLMGRIDKVGARSIYLINGSKTSELPCSTTMSWIIGGFLSNQMAIGKLQDGRVFFALPVSRSKYQNDVSVNSAEKNMFDRGYRHLKSVKYDYDDDPILENKIKSKKAR
jgi:hypothetical protein